MTRYFTKIAIIILAIWTLLPLLLITSSAFSPKSEIYQFPKPIIPSRFSIDSFQFFLRSYGTIPSLLNSILVSLLTVVFSLSIGTPAGYALARFRFVGKETFKLAILTTRMFPMMLLAIPLTVLFIRFGLYDHLIGVALLHTAIALPFVVIITGGIFGSVPKEFEEAAMVFGATRLGAFFRISLPLALPGLAVSAIFAFIISWNEVFAATILTVQNRTLPAQILTTLQASPLYFRLAGGFFMILPALIFIFFMRNYLFYLWGRSGS
ncbi:MAG TPA: carbohydrate ABC transporter permease [bacterium (Candidatus Stahlbacteria)]|nr:carbohydrate ABC transporter permease [Candidatus Stahlbacteria bacterium]